VVQGARKLRPLRRKRQLTPAPGDGAAVWRNGTAQSIAVHRKTLDCD
jgi:hypothetical protein